MQLSELHNHKSKPQSKSNKKEGTLCGTSTFILVLLASKRKRNREEEGRKRKGQAIKKEWH